VSGIPLLDWATLAISLFNTFLLLWLGLVVLLNAERRTLGVWMAGEGLLVGAAFFVSHSAILAQSLQTTGSGFNFWWQLGWLPVVFSPFGWYMVVLWYAGYWDDPLSALHRRHAPWFGLLLVLSAVLMGLLVFANPLPSFSQVNQIHLSAAPSLAGVPWLVIIYPPFIFLCILLSLEALRNPAPSGRLMGDLARRRALPWVSASTAVLLLVCLLVAWVLIWGVFTVQDGYTQSSRAGFATTILWFDLVIDFLISVAVLLVGQAVVSYEVFTGKALPRQGLSRHWRNAVFIAVVISMAAAASLSFHFQFVSIFLLAILLLAGSYALFTWRSFAEREQVIQQLRPFVTSPMLYDQMVNRGLAVDTTTPFFALCRDVLSARCAALVAMGPLASLAGGPLLYPEGFVLPQEVLAEVAASAATAAAMVFQLQQSRDSGLIWVVPLWSERGLIGALLLGGKEDGGFYAQEEIEAARASGERLVDLKASSEISRRLMELQRHKMAENALMDARARRVLHDDILPELHTVLLALNSAPEGQSPAVKAATDQLVGVHRRISDLLRSLPAAPLREVEHLGVLGALRKTLDEEQSGVFHTVVWEVNPDAERLASGLPALAAETLFYAAREAVRNAARHGRAAGEEAPLNLKITAQVFQGSLEVVVEDDGVGVEPGRSQPHGNGQGLALHSTMMAVVGGSLVLESQPGRFTRVRLVLPAGDAGLKLQD
jgi:signal transduction histidine kinase